ncbi:LysR family transcriptional regulator [Chitiniphilus purpureus]|uniref:LysR family transcriptional regulator n=1 Tax=Chitiniphilus purpureus TaxID=2981137 RepID=A0ABY6DS90_9NEIS|nr:LysR family transcriptional regulator [Chitiniphilus sp. CD1]UXY16892.1 LysR family transcriptional regulator [Chitiniphilus sp. CD1]
MLRLNLEALEILDAIVRKGSFAAAADEVHRVPSAVTYMVKKLEDELGVQLFDRSGHRAKLTAAGQTLLDEGRHLLRAAGDLECRVKRVATGWETTLNIALDGLLPMELLYPMVRDFDRLNSGTRLRFSREVLAGMWDALLDHRADLAIGVSGEGPHGGGYAARALGEVAFVFAVAPGHPLADAAEPLPASLLQQHRVVAMADTSRTLLPRTVGILSGQEILTVPDIQAKLSAQIAGLGCGYLPRCLAMPYVEAGSLVEKRVEEHKAPAVMYAAWRTTGLGRALKWWITRLAEDRAIGEWLARHPAQAPLPV